MIRTVILSFFVIGSFKNSMAQVNREEAMALLTLYVAQHADFPVQNETFNIIVVGETSVYHHLLKHSKNLHINGLKINVNTASSTEAISDAHIIFVSAEMSPSLGAINHKTKSQSLLVIAEQQDLFKNGADLSFVEDGHSFKFDINSLTVTKRNVKLSKDVFAIARVVM